MRLRSERDHIVCRAVASIAMLILSLTVQAPIGWAGSRGWADRSEPHQRTDALVRPLPPVDDAELLPPIDVAVPPCRSTSFFDGLELGFLARGYYLNDQRIQWTGQEATFGAEAILAPVLTYDWEGWRTTLDGEFYLNQPFDRNVLVDTPERASYAANFDVETFEISKLFLSVERGDLLLGIGKMATPFGHTEFPLFTNARLDAPFIRTESILWRETGALVRYTPGPFTADVAVTNGSEDRDTNSSKALVTRLGVDCPSWGVGVSLKTQDGIGSEGQKEFRSHVGADCVVRCGRWCVSGEVIDDEYGFRKSGFDPDNIFWGRSLYYRDRHLSMDEPISGLGYYVNVGYTADRWAASLNYGEYYPRQLGDPRHDVPNRRGIVKLDYRLTPWLDLYSVVMTETSGYLAQDDRPRNGAVVLAGLQWRH